MARQHLLLAADPRVLGHGHQQGARADGLSQGYRSENRVTPLALAA